MFEPPVLEEVLMTHAVRNFWNDEPTTAEAEVDARNSEAEPAPPEPDRATMVHALRDLEAAKARVERDAKRVQDEMRETLVTKLLPVLDNLDRTIIAATQAGDAESVLEGVRLVRSQLESVLRGYGAQRIETASSMFDPKQHEAISMLPVTDPRAHGTVIDQIEAGWRMGDRLLRPAKVVVARYQQPAAPPRTPRWY